MSGAELQWERGLIFFAEGRKVIFIPLLHEKDKSALSYRVRVYQDGKAIGEDRTSPGYIPGPLGATHYYQKFEKKDNKG